MTDFQIHYWEKLCKEFLFYRSFREPAGIDCGGTIFTPTPPFSSSEWNQLCDALYNDFSPIVKSYILGSVIPKWKGEYPLDNETSERAIEYCDISITKQLHIYHRLDLPNNFRGRSCVKRAHYIMLKYYYRKRLSTMDITLLRNTLLDWIDLTNN